MKDTLLGAWTILVVSCAIGLGVNHLRGLPLNSLKPYQKAYSAPQVEASVAAAQWGTSIFIDARSRRHYAESHIPKALNLFKDDPRITGLDPSRTYILYCDILCPLADQMAETLHERKFTNIYVLSGGISAWQLANYPTQKGIEER